MKPSPKTAESAAIETGPMELSVTEKALCARLIRVRRSKKYWLRYFIEHLLHMDAASPDEITTKQAGEALEIMNNFTRWQTYFHDVTEAYSVLKDFPGLDWYPWGDEGKDAAPSITADVSATLTKKEQLNDELRELHALIESPRGVSFRTQAAEYAERLKRALDRMAEEDKD